MSDTLSATIDTLSDESVRNRLRAFRAETVLYRGPCGAMIAVVTTASDTWYEVTYPVSPADPRPLSEALVTAEFSSLAYSVMALRSAEEALSAPKPSAAEARRAALAKGVLRVARPAEPLNEATLRAAERLTELNDIMDLCEEAGCLRPPEENAHRALAMVEELRQRSVCTQQHEGIALMAEHSMLWHMAVGAVCRLWQVREHFGSLALAAPALSALSAALRALHERGDASAECWMKGA
jgi:hypothetical protein